MTDKRQYARLRFHEARRLYKIMIGLDYAVKADKLPSPLRELKHSIGGQNYDLALRMLQSIWIEKHGRPLTYHADALRIAYAELRDSIQLLLVRHCYLPGQPDSI